MRLLAEAGIGRADAMMAITAEMIKQHAGRGRAKSEGLPLCHRAVNEPDAGPPMGTLGIDAYIQTPARTTVKLYLRHSVMSRAVGLFIGDAEAEVIKPRYFRPSPIAGKRVSDMISPKVR